MKDLEIMITAAVVSPLPAAFMLGMLVSPHEGVTGPFKGGVEMVQYLAEYIAIAAGL